MESVTSMRKRGRPFSKGQSGNPGGRPKTNPEVIEMLKAATPAATALLVAVVENDQAPLRLRLQADEAVLDRVYGRALQPIDATIGGNAAPVIVTFEGILDQWSR